ncbi:hypothetical protein FLONG3_2001 [Fusarium longipes]|uniref:Uncharacterized protein n=1 Tax=Fusarium longipes TaxID=694270 RepID=A0A395T573_9HYPO|nr:hypothetical protein FLONG3_2001 [Fusarium longipes]
METVDNDKPRPVAPPEPISPALSSTAAPKPSISRAASPTHAPTPDSTSTRVATVERKSPAASDSVVTSAPPAPPAAPSASEPRAATPTMPHSPLPSGEASKSAPIAKDRAPSPSAPSTSTVNGKSPVIAATSAAPAAAKSPSPRQVKS